MSATPDIEADRAAGHRETPTALELKPPPQGYQHENPGDLLHLDIKKLGRFERVGHRITGRRVGTPRGAGWEYVHVSIDDCSRIAHGKI